MADTPPVRLSDLTAELSQLYLTLSSNLDADSAKKFRDGLKKIEDALADVRDALHVKQNQNVDNEWKKPLDDRRKWIADLNKKYTLAEAEPVRLSEFFRNVSTSVIEAQTQLNRDSEEYARQLRLSQSNIPPSYYAIPSIKAEMKVAFRDMSRQGVNVIFFTRKEQKEQYLESTVTFELVSVPAPLNPPGSSPPVGPLSRAMPPLAGDAPPAVAPLLTAPREIHLADAREMDFAAPREMAADVPRAMDFAEARTESFVLATPEREGVLDWLSREFERMEQPLGKIYENARAEAVVFRRTEGEKTEYLVVWPGHAVNATSEGWRELSVFHLSDAGAGLAFDASIFDDPPKKGFLTIASETQLRKETRETLADLVINLGDALAHICLVVNPPAPREEARPRRRTRAGRGRRTRAKREGQERTAHHRDEGGERDKEGERDERSERDEGGEREGEAATRHESAGREGDERGGREGRRAGKRKRGAARKGRQE